MCKSCIDNNKIGRIELIIGCMFAGKTEEFLRRIRRLKYAKMNTVIFKPTIDNRYLKDSIVSHNKIAMKCIQIKEIKEIEDYLKDNPKVNVIGVDEIQFFDPKIVSLLNQLAKEKYIIIAAGLDLDFKEEPFKTTKELFPIADFITKLHAICIKCGNYANRTQRIVDGNPAKKSDPRILIGSKESYEARCRRCYFI